MTHIVCVDAYEGAFEPIAEAGAVRRAGLGLSWPELATLLDARVTLLDWNAWYDYEERGDSPASWMHFPATRATQRRRTPRVRTEPESPRITHRSLVVLDPDDDRPLDVRPLSKRAFGMLAEGDPLFYLSVLLYHNLLLLHREESIDLIVLPMWGGLGYITQLEAHTGDGLLSSSSIAVVVTSTSRSRFAANQEGEWTRPAIARHQREELSLALADVAVVFGNHGRQLAQSGRLRTSRQPVLAPFFVAASELASLRSGTTPKAASGPLQFSLAGPSDGASGAIPLLAAARLGPGLPSPIVLAGEDRTFAPMAPRSFREYWGSRGWVRELLDGGSLAWRAPASAEHTDIRLYAGPFSHLADPLSDLSSGRLALFGPAAADTLAGASLIPEALRLAADPTPELLAARLAHLAGLPAEEIERLRSALGAALIQGAQGGEWESRLQHTADALRLALRTPRAISIAQVLKRQLDPRRPLNQLPDTLAVTAAEERATLTVVVPCYALGDLIEESVTSIWQSSRIPDEVIIVDDGSTDVPTRNALANLARRAETGGFPLRVLRQSNRGLAAARNAGLGAANGTFISFLDGDDLIDPSFYRLAVTLLIREPDLGGVAAWADIFGDEVAFWNAPQPELPLLLVENLVIVPVVMRAALLRAVGGYDERQGYNYEDWELVVRLLARGHPIVTLPRYLQRYRVRGNSLYRTMTPVQHQVMREVMLESHAATLASFATEVALQLEHRLAEKVFIRAPAVSRIAARNVLARVAARLRRITGN
jgi:hypothetical protein